MKKMLLTLVAMIGMTFPAQAMTYNQARTEALFLTDKMAYELALSNDQYEVVYEINFDYFYSLVGQTDLYGIAWQRRDSDLKYVLTVAQYERMIARDYFYRPVNWNSGWNFTIYTHYTNRYHMYYARPVAYGSYRGGHSWRHNNNQSYYQTRSYYYSKNIRQHSSRGQEIKRQQPITTTIRAVALHGATPAATTAATAMLAREIQGASHPLPPLRARHRARLVTLVAVISELANKNIPA